MLHEPSLSVLCRAPCSVLIGLAALSRNRKWKEARKIRLTIPVDREIDVARSRSSTESR